MSNGVIDTYGNVVAILGGHWGDEGKGKLIDIMAEKFDIVARAAGGANAGHTVYVPDTIHPEQTKKYIFRLMPSGVLYPHVKAVIGNGCVVHLPTLFEEIEFLKNNDIDVEGRILVSDRAHLVFEYHKEIDGMQEEMKGKNQVGTTKRGIGPAYTDKISRMGIRAHELLDFHKFEAKMRTNVEVLKRTYNLEFDIEKELDWYQSNLPRIKPLIADTSFLLNTAIADGKKLLLEGANGALLDIDHGTYPFVTSSNATIGGIVSGTGISATKLTSVVGIMKAYCTRVGAGPFPTEQENDIGKTMQTTGGEFGSVTGRPRRCGWFDAVASRYSVMVNGYKSINLTKLDVLDDFDTLKIGTQYMYRGKELTSFPSDSNILSEVEVNYIEMPGWKQRLSDIRKIEDLPENAKNYVKKLEELIGCPIESVGVGISRDQMAWA